MTDHHPTVQDLLDRIRRTFEADSSRTMTDCALNVVKNRANNYVRVMDLLRSRPEIKPFLPARANSVNPATWQHLAADVVAHTLAHHLLTTSTEYFYNNERRLLGFRPVVVQNVELIGKILREFDDDPDVTLENTIPAVMADRITDLDTAYQVLRDITYIEDDGNDRPSDLMRVEGWTLDTVIASAVTMLTGKLCRKDRARRLESHRRRGNTIARRPVATRQ